MTNTLQQLQRAMEIVERYRARGNVLPRELGKNYRNTPENLQGMRECMSFANHAPQFFTLYRIPRCLQGQGLEVQLFWKKHAHMFR